MRRRARRAAGDAGRRHPDPHRNRGVADAGGADRRVPRRASRRRSGCSGSRSAATTRARAAAWRSASTSTRSTPIEKADVILSLDADFLCTGAAGLPHARAFASRRRARRRPRAAQSALRGREHADQHRHEGRSPPAAARLGDRGASRAPSPRSSAWPAPAAGAVPEAAQAWIAPLVKDLQAARGRSLVIAGDGQPPIVHALAHAMNEALGNVGTTVVYTQTAEAQPMNQLAGLQRAGRRDERRHGRASC